jgi:hypothetical protein
MMKLLLLHKRNICSDGTLATVENCPNKKCESQQDQCPDGTEYWQLSKVEIPIAKGVGQFCLNAAVGIQQGAGPVVQIGVDVATLNGASSAVITWLNMVDCGLFSEWESECMH